MNQHTTIVAADAVDAAISTANNWFAIGEPILKAFYALDQVEAELRVAGHSWADTYEGGYFDTACKMIERARDKLFDQLDAIRDNAIGDVSFDGPAGVEPQDAVAYSVWADAWDFSEEANDRLQRETTTVEQARKRVADR